MKYKELIDSIKLRNEVYIITRKIPKIDFGRNIIYHWILQAEREIQLRTQILINSKKAVMIADNTVLGLPADFGKIISLIIDKTEIDYKSYRDFKLLDNNTLYYTITQNDETLVYDTNWLSNNNQIILIYPKAKTGDEIILNYHKTIIDSPSLYDETLDIQLPINYINAIELKVLSMLYPEYIIEYEREIIRLIEYSDTIPIETIGGDYGI